MKTLLTCLISATMFFQTGFCNRVEDPYHNLSEDYRTQFGPWLERIAEEYNVGIYIFAYPLVQENASFDETVRAVVQAMEKNGSDYKPHVFVYFGVGDSNQWHLSCMPFHSSAKQNVLMEGILAKAATAKCDLLHKHIRGVEFSLLPAFVSDTNRLISLVIQRARQASYDFNTGEFKPEAFPSQFDMFQTLVEYLDEADLEKNPDLLMRKVLAWENSETPDQSYTFEDALRDLDFVLKHASEHTILAVCAQMHRWTLQTYVSLKIADLVDIRLTKEMDSLLQTLISEFELTGALLHQKVFEEANRSEKLKDLCFQFISLFSSDPDVIFGDVTIYNKQLNLNNEGRISYSYDYDVTNLENNSRVRIHATGSL